VASNPTSVANVGVGVYRLTWGAGEMVQGGNIIITVTGVKDVAGNPIPTTGMAYVGEHVGGGIGVQPTVTTVAVVSGGQTGAVVDVSYSEPMNNLGASTASSYAVSGTGRGTLASNPDSAVSRGGGVYRLTWIAGEMKNGGDITVTVTPSAVTDLAGNTVNPAGNSGTHMAGAAGALPSVTMTSTTVAPPGFTNVTPILVTVTFSEPVSGFASTDIAKTNATIRGSRDRGLVYVQSGSTSGSVSITADISAGAAQDAAGNLSTGRRSLHAISTTWRRPSPT